MLLQNGTSGGTFQGARGCGVSEALTCCAGERVQCLLGFTRAEDQDRSSGNSSYETQNR
jgi:hypothetical protein